MKAMNKEVQKAAPNPTIAILQLTRFGDLIQTAQALKNIKDTHPQYRIILIARSQFATPLNFLLEKYFDCIYPLKGSQIFKNALTGGLSASKKELDDFLDSLKHEKIDALINLSFSKSSSYLASLIAAKHKLGQFHDLNNKIQINDKWSQVLFSTVMRGPFNPFSLVDLFKNIIGITSPSSPPREKTVEVKKRENFIVFHPFASAERKMWKAEKWVEVIYKTLKDNAEYSIVLVGAKNEFLKSQIIIENPLLKTFSERLINSVGKTSLQELSLLLERAKLFVGHDSMVGHLSASTNTPAFIISLGNVRPYETTPYQAQSYNIAPRTKCFPCFPSDPCAYNQCHYDIPYQLVSNLVKQILRDEEISSKTIKNTNSDFHLSSVNLYRSHFQNGTLALENLTSDHADVADVFRLFYKITWLFVLNDHEEAYPFPNLSPNSHSALLDALKGLQHLFELSEFGQKYSRFILEEIATTTPSISKIKEFSKKIDEIDLLQEMVQKTSPHLSPVIDYFKVRKANLFGENIVALTESSYLIFEENAQIASVLFELIQNTVAEYKIGHVKKTTKTEINT